MAVPVHCSTAAIAVSPATIKRRVTWAEDGYRQESGEPPQPDKRASIAVNVQAAHDADNLYLRFAWDDTDHVPVPFVDGGKMDPENPMKLAVMLATDDVEFADRSGCWQTCHHDVRTMPDTPAADAATGNPAAQRLNLAMGITKYLKESRTDIEVQGRRGKVRAVGIS